MNWEKVIQNVQDKLYRFSLRITGNSVEAEDIVQEIRIRLWNKALEINDLKNPEAWCMTLAKNLSLDKLRSKHRRTEDADGLQQVIAPSENPYQQMEKGDMMQQIRLILNHLPEKQRMVMHLRDIEGMTYEEIVEQLEMPMSQVKINLFRARQTVRERWLEIDHYLK
jgi:RNA polymerase sigma-70 factor (ECF subfamily)